MHFHLPKPLHGWREFVGEVGIIVVGVLIALSAEQAVQSWEWRQRVRSSIEDMKQELGNADGPEAYARLAIHNCLARRLGDIQNAVESANRARSWQLIHAVWLPNRTYDSLARESATASDIASHMPTKRMFQFRIVYSLMPEMDRLQDNELAELAHLRALPSSGGPLGQSEKFGEIDALEALTLDNDRMARGARFILRQMGQASVGLNRAALDDNMEQARAHYGACVVSKLH